MSQCQMCGREIPDGQQLCPTCRNAWEWRQRQQAQGGPAPEVPGGVKAPTQADPGQPPKAGKPVEAAKAERAAKASKHPKTVKPSKTAPKTPKAKVAQPGRLLAVILGAVLVAFLLFFGAALLFGRSGGSQGPGPVTLDTWQEESTVSAPADPGPDQVVATAPEQALPQQPTDSQPGAEGQQTADAGEYIFPNSDSAYLARDQVAALTPDQLRLARNEIYARHGRIFQDETLAAYFGSKSWYQPLYDGATFDALGDSILNEYEIANRDLIQEYEALYNGQ